jgi:predicted Holliday junction resolvase-like endonuclease
MKRAMTFLGILVLLLTPVVSISGESMDQFSERLEAERRHDEQMYKLDQIEREMREQEIRRKGDMAEQERQIKREIERQESDRWFEENIMDKYRK